VIDGQSGPAATERPGRSPRRRLAERVALLRRAYEAFNRRDFEAVLALLDRRVEWPNLIEGRTLRGRDEVRAYWQRQLETIDPRVEPVGFAERGDEVVVDVHQVVRARDGAVLSDSRVAHVYAFARGRVRAMRVER